MVGIVGSVSSTKTQTRLVRTNILFLQQCILHQGVPRSRHRQVQYCKATEQKLSQSNCLIHRRVPRTLLHTFSRLHELLFAHLFYSSRPLLAVSSLSSRLRLITPDTRVSTQASVIATRMCANKKASSLFGVAAPSHSCTTLRDMEFTSLSSTTRSHTNFGSW